MASTAPVEQQLQQRLAVFRPRDRNLILRGCLTEAGNAWITEYLPRRFTSYARTALGYYGPEHLSAAELYRAARAAGHVRAVQEAALQGWDPFRHFYPPVPHSQFPPFTRWYAANGYHAEGARYRSPGARRNWWIHVRREFTRWARRLVRHQALRRLGVNPDALPAKVPFLKTGDLRTTGLAGARSVATSTDTRGAQVRILIPRPHPMPASAGVVFARIPPAEEALIQDTFRATVDREIGQAQVRVGRGKLAKPRTILAAPAVERLRQLLAQAGPKPITPTRLSA
jgi:hypothetical protein